MHYTRFMGSTGLGALVVAGVLAAATSLQAGPVSLKSPDGAIDISGDLLGFENNEYIVSTVLGDLRISADQVTCSGEGCPVIAPTGSSGFDYIRIAGSDTVGEALIPFLLEGWAASLEAKASSSTTDVAGQLVVSLTGEQGFGEPLSEITVTSTSSGDAFRTLLAREADLGMASRRVNAIETRDLRNAGLGDLTDPAHEHIIAVDSLVTIVHPDNPVQILNLEQLRGIFNGSITNWRQVGGPDAPINVYDRDADSGTRSAFMSSLFDTPPQQPDNVTIAVGNIEMADSVAADPNAIGFVGYAFQRGARVIPLENECGMTVIPDSFSARTEEYAFQRRLYLYSVEGGLTPTSQEFLNYVQSIDADEMIEKSGFISLGIVARPQPFDSLRAESLLAPVNNQLASSQSREMLRAMVDFDRLSSTFRFDSGSSQLDRRAPLDMARLTDYLEMMPAGTEVKFVGFTDSAGSYENNQALSERRAAEVMASMMAFSGDRLNNINISSTGFGEVAPTACNINEGGRQINRRVEVWISVPDAI